MEPEAKKNLERVAEVWDKAARERAVHPLQGWLDSQVLQQFYIRPRISGAPDVPWLASVVNRHRIPRSGRWLSLGCGSAQEEIIAAKEGLFASLVALDASPASLEEGRRAALAQGLPASAIEFGAVDFDHLDLPPGAYDVVLMNMSLHHVRKLRFVLRQIYGTLKPTGFFLINEYIGPRRFQFTDLQLLIVRELLEILPAKWRRDSATGELKTDYPRLPVAHWSRVDPSEAIRSDRIVPEIDRLFRVVERIDYGGTILNLLLEHILQNFDPSEENDVAVLRLLAKTEDLLIRGGVLPSDFVVMALRKLPQPLTLLRRLRGSRARALKEEEEALLAPSISGDMADFRRAGHSAQVVSGLFQWEASARWMGPRGELSLRMTSNKMAFVFAAPVSELARRHPDWSSLAIRVRLEEPRGRSVDLEPISITEDRPVQYFREVPEPFASLFRGQPVRVILECDRVWIPAETLPPSEDLRKLTIQVMQVGFEPVL